MKKHSVGILLATALAAAAGAPAAPKPDILLIMPDQMRGDCLSALGHPVVRTPTLDALAASGGLFRRAYSEVPSCIPARFFLLTGLAPQSSGVVGFAAKPMWTPTLPGSLAGAGYVTALIGRNMHQPPASGDLGYQSNVLGSTYVNDDDYDRWLTKTHPESGGIGRIIGRLKLSCNHWPANAWDLPDDAHPTAWIAREAQQAVASAPAAQPLFLTASFYAPHPPLFPPAKYFDALMKRDLPKPAFGDWVDRAALTTAGDKQGHRILLEGDTLRRAQAGYFGLIEQVDEVVAPLIAAFKARSEKAGRPWIVAVTSDHGEMLGDHGYFRKCEPYEGSARIPFIVSAAPALGLKAGMRCDRPVGLEDLMPTLLELAEVPRPAGMDGVSLVPALRGEAQEVRPWLHFEHAPCYGPAQAFQALTDGRMKYIWRPLDGAESLFDLEADPREEHDLAKVADRRADLETWRACLVKRLAGRPEGFSDGQRLIPGRDYPAIQGRPVSKKAKR